MRLAIDLDMIKPFANDQGEIWMDGVDLIDPYADSPVSSDATDVRWEIPSNVNAEPAKRTGGHNVDLTTQPAVLPEKETMKQRTRRSRTTANAASVL